MELLRLQPFKISLNVNLLSRFPLTNNDRAYNFEMSLQMLLCDVVVSVITSVIVYTTSRSLHSVKSEYQGFSKFIFEILRSLVFRGREVC